MQKKFQVKENMHVRKASQSVRSDIDHNCKYLKRSPGFANQNLATSIIESCSKRGISFGLWKHHVNLFPELSIRNPDLHQCMLSKEEVISLDSE
jgi:hypothetical protein